MGAGQREVMLANEPPAAIRLCAGCASWLCGELRDFLFLKRNSEWSALGPESLNYNLRHHFPESATRPALWKDRDKSQIYFYRLLKNDLYACVCVYEGVACASAGMSVEVRGQLYGVGAYTCPFVGFQD